MLSGIDVSSYQSATPDLTGKSFVFVKATEGTSYINPEQGSQAQAGRAAGCVVGFYHYLTGDDVQAQAQFFVDKCDSVPGDVLVIDWEKLGVSCAAKDAALKAVKALRPTHRVLLYCDRDQWLNVDTTSYCEDGLWIADYSHPAGQPAIQHPWLFHQYTDSPEDEDVANFASLADLQAWATGGTATTSGTSTKAAPAPTPTPAPAPSAVPQWRQLLDHVEAVKEGVYEHWNANGGWDNHTQWGIEYGEDGVPYCVIGAWDMYHECGLDKAVPKVDNVVVFSDWARSHGEWSEYPSIGAWTNFGNGHCEIVIGFTATDVITKGWNSVKAGSTDSGQGNGVWVHTNARTSPRVVGYLAPHFPDGHCPPTADPKDPRGGTAQTSYTWPGPATPAKPAPAPAPKPEPKPAPKPAPTPVVRLSHILAARKEDLPAATGHKTCPADVLIVENALHAEGLLDKQYVDGSWGTKTDDAYHAFRLKAGYKGTAATGDPGIESLTKLGKKHGFTVTV